MSITMTPFLYQTKTLCHTAWSKPALISGRQSTRIVQKAFSSASRQSTSNRYYPPSNATEAPPSTARYNPPFTKSRYVDENDTSLRARPRATPKRMWDRKSRSTWEDDIPLETNAAGFRHPTGELHAVNLLDTVQVNEFGEADDGAFDERGRYDYKQRDGDEDMGFYGDDGLDSLGPRGPRESTITDSEKRAFQRIFEEMFAQNQGEAFAPTSLPQMTSNEPSSERANSKLDAILKLALEQNAEIQQEKEVVVNRYPPSLRPSVAKAVGLSDDDAEVEPPLEDTAEEPELDHNQLEVLREPERIRVETLMNEAQTDFELWEIMKKEVFSLIPRLGLENASSTIEAPKVSQPKKQKGRRKEEQEPTPQDTELAKFEDFVKDGSTGAGVPALHVYGPLYPSHLLLGIRLLDRSFAKPSPLALSILPKVKSLGPISQVLGASTQLYNEVLRTYFYRYEDFRAIAETLKEMEDSAVELDEETLEIVTNIIKAQARVARGERGPVVKVLWRTPRFTASNFLHWKAKITEAIAARSELGEKGQLKY